MTRRIAFFAAWLPVVLWIAAIFSFSSLPEEALPDIGIIGADKFGHMLEFFVLGVLSVRAFSKSSPNLGSMKIIISSILIASLCAAINELQQYFVATRNADILDFLSDLIGANIGVIIYVRRINWHP